MFVAEEPMRGQVEGRILQVTGSADKGLAVLVRLFEGTGQWGQSSVSWCHSGAQFLVLSLPPSVIFDKSLSPTPVPRFPHLQNGNNDPSAVVSS